MKAAYLERAREISIQDVERPNPGPFEVLVKVAAIGVCASDIHYYAHGRIGTFVDRDPQILGHEVAGEVVVVVVILHGCELGRLSLVKFLKYMLPHVLSKF